MGRFLKRSFNVYVCINLHEFMCTTCMLVPTEVRRESLGTEVTSNCKLPDVGRGN